MPHTGTESALKAERSSRPSGTSIGRDKGRIRQDKAGTEVSGASDNQAHANEQGTPHHAIAAKVPTGSERNTPN